MSKKQSIDFHAVPAAHVDIDRRLHNWSRWCNGREHIPTSPMFRLCRINSRARSGNGIMYGVGVDKADAVEIGKAVAALPEKHRAAINWAYVKPVSPTRAAKVLGTSLEGLAKYLNDARQMLINRGY